MRPLHYIKKKFTFTFANGATGADLIQSQAMSLEGELLNIHQINGSNTGTRTAKLEVIDDTDAFTLFDGTAKAHNASYEHEFGVTIRRILAGANSLRCTISGDPGASGYVINAIITLFGRDG